MKLLQGAGFNQVNYLDSDESMGRGTASLWNSASIVVIPATPERGQHIECTMDVPKQMCELSDEEIILRFIAGFNGGK